MAKRRKCAETDEEEATTKKLKRAMRGDSRAKTRVKNKDTGTKKKSGLHSFELLLEKVMASNQVRTRRSDSCFVCPSI